MINPQPVDEPRSPYTSVPLSSASMPPTPPLPVGQNEPPQKPKRRIGRWVALFFVVLALGAAGFAYAQYKHLINLTISPHNGATSSVLKNHLTANSEINAADYTKPGDGRINIVVVGVGGGTHPGAYLTDTIQVVSIDTIHNKMTVTSIPRDLYVDIPGFGKAKINATYTLAEGQKKGSGKDLVRQVVGTVLGINITNFVLIDFSAIKDIVNTLGGIDVTTKAISDPFFPCDDTLHYCPFYITAGPHHLDGTTALEYSRSRETTSDFDRSARQQVVMQAIKQKALSIGFLANPLKISTLTTTLGQHFNTDLQPDDILSLISIYKNIPNDSASTGSFVLDTSTQLGLLHDTTDPVAGYISFPAIGIGKFDAIHQWFQHNNPDPVLAKESPSVTVFGNAKTTQKQLQSMSDTLTNYGYKVTISTTPYTDRNYTTVTGFTLNSDKQVSANYLNSILNSSLQSNNPSDFNTDFAVFVPSTVTVNSYPVPTPSPTATPTATPQY